MSKRGDAIKDATRRARIRQMIAAGFTNAKIIKSLGMSHVHGNRLVEQERFEIARGVQS